MFRKRKNPTPNFRMPPPFAPMSGEHAPLQLEGFFPYCAMMQIAETDTHDDYVVCRGFDVRIHKFNEAIPVAKPYSKRMAGLYNVAEIYPAMLPLQTSNPSPSDVPWRVGQNPGVAETTAGHPADLNETVDELYDTNGQLINYMLIDAGGGTFYKIRFTIVSVAAYIATVTITARSHGISTVPGESSGQVMVYDPCQCFFDEPAADLVGRCGTAWYADPDPAGGGDSRFEVDSLCCPEC